MIVGEVPGDKEDLAGRPFVGPAGRILDDALATAGLQRKQVYITNVVKHFNWEPRGKRRLHSKPKLREISACRPWLEAELRVVRPHAIICLGATAAQSLLGKDFRITRNRGQVLVSDWAHWVLSTWHPSAVLRAPDARDRERLRQEFFDDVRTAIHMLSTSGNR